ncbi:hypothetical protein CLOSTMETH_01577 [[Clostridium] methylpentosum DSM 5476]|uniref:Uncharacterized protein n=1 Tax=[Clostridium] methylpentosum DSM 5476 TaxID=537013 RepID=C0ECK6_9FIRM|nr:hypothetical protein CLOSTMETH_01577 [[Clostridium] methylpentosum DSM 5476]
MFACNRCFAATVILFAGGRFVSDCSPETLQIHFFSLNYFLFDQ